MLNNIFCFSDMTFKQLNGTAMGTPPAPPYATIYYGIHEKNFLPKHNKHVIFYKRFIAVVFGIWIPHPNPQTNAQLWEHSMNAFPGLTWEFEDPSDKVNFMDLTITIKNGHVSTSLFEKFLNLHLYIPPIPPIHLDSSPASSTVHYFVFSPSAQITTTGSYAQECFLNDSRHVAIRVTKSNHFSIKQYHEPNNTLDQQIRQEMIIHL